MNCIVDYGNGKSTERELTPELVKALENKAFHISGDYCNYILSIYVDEKDKKIHLGFNGPWEC